MQRDRGFFGDLFRQLHRFCFEFGGWVNVVDEAKFMGRLGVDHITGQGHLHRSPLADQPRQTLRAASAAHDAEIYFGLCEPGIFACYTQIASKCEFITAAETETVDHRDHRFWKSVDRVEKRLFVKQIALGNRRLALEFANVGTSDK